MHHQIWYTHWGQEVPKWVYAFWKCKPVFLLFTNSNQKESNVTFIGYEDSHQHTEHTTSNQHSSIRPSSTHFLQQETCQNIGWHLHKRTEKHVEEGAARKNTYSKRKPIKYHRTHKPEFRENIFTFCFALILMIVCESKLKTLFIDRIKDTRYTWC